MARGSLVATAMDSLLSDLRYAVRTLLKSPGFTLVAVLTLALGIGANTAIFSVLYGVLLRPLPYPEPDRLVGLSEVYQGNRDERDVTYAEFTFLRDNTSSFESFAVSTSVGFDVYASGGAERVDGLRVSKEYFRALGVHPALGRDFAADEDVLGGPNVVILSHGLWVRGFGSDPSLVGRAISVEGAPYTVVGVLPAGFRSPFPVDLYSTMGQVSRSIGGGENLHVIARLGPGTTVAQAQNAAGPAVAAFMRQFIPHAPTDFAIGFYPYRQLLVTGFRTPIGALFVAVGLVLLIACANVANLVLSRAAARTRELAVRVSLGATRRRLARQLLTESVLLGLVGGAAGLVVADWGLSLLLPLVPTDLARASDIRLDGRALLFTAAASVLTGLLFGFVAAWRAGTVDLRDALKEGSGRTTAAPGEGRLRNTLVVAEVALSLVLSVGAGLLIQSIANLVRTDTGFDPSHVVAAEMWLTGSGYDSTAQIAGFYQRLEERLAATPGVRSAGVVEAGIPLVQGGNFGAAVSGTYLEATINYRTVTPEYFPTMGIPVKQGRNFGRLDVGSSEPVAVVSESFARRFLGPQPLDRMVVVGGRNQPPRRVVGVVGDVKQLIDMPVVTTVFLPSAQTPAGFTRLFSGWFPINVVVRTAGDPAVLKATVERVVRETDAHVPVGRVRTMDEILSDSLALRRLVMLLLSLFAGLAAVLAAVGTYGVMSYLVAQRTHEFGVRVALGAPQGEVLRTVLVRGLALAGGGALLGLAGAAALTRLLASQLYGVEPLDPLTFAAVTGVLLLVALVACWIPARRATKVDPIVALRSE